MKIVLKLIRRLIKKDLIETKIKMSKENGDKTRIWNGKLKSKESKPRRNKLKNDGLKNLVRHKM